MSFYKQNLASSALECFRLYLEMDPSNKQVQELFGKCIQLESKDVVKTQSNVSAKVGARELNASR